MKKPTQSHSIRIVTLWACGLIAAPLLAAFVFISLRIGAKVYAASEMAMQQHQGDRVEALMRYVGDINHSFRERNLAVWALGQLGDRRALALLRKHHSGKPCDHASALCQRELGKAIELVEGGVNATALVWRHSAAR